MFNPELYNYWVVIVLMMVGFYTLITRGNLVKKMIGLNVFQVSVFMLYISMGKVTGGTAPIVPDDVWKQMKESHKHAHVEHEGHGDHHGHADSRAALPRDDRSLYTDLDKRAGDEPPKPVKREVEDPTAYSNPLPHVLILTAIVVGVATTALALALVVRIREEYGTIEDDELIAMDEPK